MYALEEIQKIVSDVVDKLKVYDTKTSGGRKCTWDDIPEYWPGYKKAYKYMKDIKVHAEIGEYPEDLFAVRAPNQTDKEAKYIKANYKQNTLPVFMDYLSTMQRPFFDGNWSIDYQTDQWADGYISTETTLQDYVEGEITGVGNLENFVKQILSQMKAVDANGVVAIKPRDIPVAEVDTPDGVQYEVDNTQLFDPVPFYYSTDKKLAFKRGKYYLIKSDENSVVTYYNRGQLKGHVFEFYDDQNIWRIVQTGNFTDYTFEYYLYFNHQIGKVPVAELKGVPQPLDSDNLIWISPFHFAVPNLNNALVSSQYLNASKDRTMFPYLVMVGRPCTFEYENTDGQRSACTQGSVYNSTTGQNMQCPHCKGTGQQDRISPFGVLLLNPDSEFNKGDASLGQKAMYYVSPDPVALEFVRDCIAKDFGDARKMLHQQTSNSVVKGTENLTATGMSLDTKSMFAFVKTPSDQIFEIYEFCLDGIGMMRYGSDYVKAVLVNPSTFDYNTEADYLYQIGEAQKAGLAPSLIHSITFRYLQTLYYNERERAAVFTLMINTDRVFTLSQDDIMLKFNRGLVQDWEVIIHDSAIGLISELMVENATFFEQDFSKQQQDLIALAKTKVPAKPSTTAVESILKVA